MPGSESHVDASQEAQNIRSEANEATTKAPDGQAIQLKDPAQPSQDPNAIGAADQAPKNNLPIVFGGLMALFFLSALDQTIVSTALPTIARELRSGPSGFTWVASAYLLTGTVMMPLWGSLSDIIGRKPLLWIAIFFFMLGSVLCAVAKNMTWLCVCRGVQGIGGGGLVALAQILNGDLVPLHKRGAFAGLFGLVWGFATVVGPLVGGALAQRVSWRWCFYINLPIGGVAALVLFFSLKVSGKRISPKAVWQTFDKIGFCLISSAVLLFLLGFIFAETDGFNSAKSIALIAVGGSLLPVTVCWEFFLETWQPQVRPVLAPRLFKTRTTTIVLAIVALHAAAFFAATYYLPVYFQAVFGSSPVLSAVEMMPFSFVAAVVSVISGVVVTKTTSYRPVMWFGVVVYCLGSGLMILLRANSSAARREIVILIAGIGAGCLFQTPLIAIMAAMPPKDMAVSTAGMSLVRSASAAIGITISGAIFNAELRSKASGIPGFTLPLNPSQNLPGLADIQPMETSVMVRAAYADALRTLWIVWTPFLGALVILAPLLKPYSLRPPVAAKPSSQDVEKAAASKEDGPSARDKAHDTPGSGPSD